MEILFADRDLLLCRKPAGQPAQPDLSGRPDLLSELAQVYPAVRLIHRLDTPTGGVMVFGLTPASTARLCTLVQEHERFIKEYLAVLPSPLSEPAGEWQDYLYHDKRMNKAYVVDNARRGAKSAKLAYRTLAVTPNGHTLVLVRLYTGRTHQIRVQFASRGYPLLGDGKYGSRVKCPTVGLWSYRMTFPHPQNGQTVTATALPDAHEHPWADFEDILQSQSTF